MLGSIRHRGFEPLLFTVIIVPLLGLEPRPPMERGPQPRVYANSTIEAICRGGGIRTPESPGPKPGALTGLRYTPKWRGSDVLSVDFRTFVQGFLNPARLSFTLNPESLIKLPYQGSNLESPDPESGAVASCAIGQN